MGNNRIGMEHPMKVPIPPHWFWRSMFSGNGLHAPCVLGFSVRFPGRTPRDAHAWLKAHGYVYHGREWSRADRKPTRLTPQGLATHRVTVTVRRRKQNQNSR